MANFNSDGNKQAELVTEIASSRGMRINSMYGQYAVTRSAEHIEQVLRRTGKLRSGVIALCGTLEEVNDFLQGVSVWTDQPDNRPVRRIV